MSSDFCVIDRENIEATTKNNYINLVLKTINEGKQVLVFNNSKSSSEKFAEDLADSITVPAANKEKLTELSDKVLKSLSSPTKQCRRLAKVVEKGFAFHHSGLTAKQRNVVEKGFREGYLRVISSTPTLAAGLNLPAYKVLVKDHRRYSARGFGDIPVLEYHQMSGRAGRPGVEDVGKAVLCAKDDQEAEKIANKYIFGEPEEIISKLAVEPTLKMYLLSLIAMDMINTWKEIESFFSNTFYAYQYGDIGSLNSNLRRLLEVLKDYGFVEQDDDYYIATPLGKKISELYLNPDTAYYFLRYIENFFKLFYTKNYSKTDIYSLIYLFVNTLEFKPLFRVKKKEEEDYAEKAERLSDDLVVEFDPFDMSYEEHLNVLKTSDVLHDWINEAHEDYISEKYGVTPGELNYKLDVSDWLLYSLEEISLMKKNFYFKNFLNKLRTRFKKGVKEELIPLVGIKGLGRVRARKLYNAGYKKVADLKRAGPETLSKYLGDSLAEKVISQVSSEDSSDNKLEDNRPKRIKGEEVSKEEVEQLVHAVENYEKQKDEGNKTLTDYF